MLELDGQRLSLAQIAAVARGDEQVSLTSAARARAEQSRKVVEQIVAEGRTVYGVNTGFGKLSDVHIEKSQLRELQLNLVRSHSCGLGAPLSEAEARAMLPAHRDAERDVGHQVLDVVAVGEGDIVGVVLEKRRRVRPVGFEGQEVGGDRSEESHRRHSRRRAEDGISTAANGAPLTYGASPPEGPVSTRRFRGSYLL